jgi:starch synthase (maltosyl-transferring)
MDTIQILPFIEGQERVIIENVKPEIDGGKFPAKRVEGEIMEISANVFADGHDILSAEVIVWQDGVAGEKIIPMALKGNDKWMTHFTPKETGWYKYTIRGWIDPFKTWYHGILKKYDAGVDIEVELQMGSSLLNEICSHVNAKDFNTSDILVYAELLSNDKLTPEQKLENLNRGNLLNQIHNLPYRQHAVTYSKKLALICERKKASFSAWYEMFPRSVWNDEKTKGTFNSALKRLPYIADMGFDIVYLPPISPIGNTKRKGKNNSQVSKPGESGSPWAIGSKDGGHKSVNPELGTIEDFQQFVSEAKKLNIDVAIDIAFQCSPDHPYVKEHPEWFKKRPDGSIQYAENPPKKYEDIYPLNFENTDWKNLWEELKSVFVFWIEKGVMVFRVDNPHTKSLHFWGWIMHEIRRDYPEVIFLSEAFTRPAIMYQLAKQGFTQSYTYFTWRNTKHELEKYFTELTRSEVKDFFRPNLWPNTPDILPEFLQVNGRQGYIQRLVLAATLGASYGIYGPAFELMENTPLEWGKEEYLDSEKFEIKNWDTTKKESLKGVIKRLNKIRQENEALHSIYSLDFHKIDNEYLLAYSKHTQDFSNIILSVVNLDPHHTHSGYVQIPIKQYGIEESDTYQVMDLVSNSTFLWTGSRNYVEINPGVFPAHLFKIRRKVHTEQDFDYFM